MEETAYHEAGHAVMAITLGARVIRMTIEPDRDDGPARHGDLLIAWNTGRLTPGAFQERLILTALAGPAAEMIYTGEPYHPGFVPEWCDDWRQADLEAGAMLPDPVKRLRFLEECVREVYYVLSEKRWPAVAALADELAAHETLEEEQIREVVDYWLRNS